MKKLVILLFLCAVAVIAIKTQGKRQNRVTSLLLENIEALAADESNLPAQCRGTGSLDCPRTHDKVKYVATGYRGKIQF